MTIATPPNSFLPSCFFKHWHGEYSLARSFWLNLIGFKFAWVLICLGYWMVLFSYLPGQSNPVRTAILFLFRYTNYFQTLITLFEVCFSLWAFVGIYRAAKRAKAQGAGKAGRFIATIIAALFIPYSAMNLLANIIVPLMPISPTEQQLADTRKDVENGDLAAMRQMIAYDLVQMQVTKSWEDQRSYFKEFVEITDRVNQIRKGH